MVISASSTAETVGLSVVGLYLAILIVVLWAYIRIIQRAGYSGWWILIGVVPLVNVVMFLLFAFKEWPIQRELAQLRAMAGQGDYRWGPPPVAGGYPPAVGEGYPPAVGGGYPPEDYGNRSRFGSAWPDEQPR